MLGMANVVVRRQPSSGRAGSLNASPCLRAMSRSLALMAVRRAWPASLQESRHPVSAGGDSAARERLDVVGNEGLTADTPLATGDLLDQAPRDRSQLLALDRDHRVGEALDDLLLLKRREDALDELDLDERHAVLLVGTDCCSAILRPNGTPHIGHIPRHRPPNIAPA